MLIPQSNIDPIWEQKYAAGHAERYPWDVVVSFVFRNAPRKVGRSDVRILEVGCGTGSNLWFAAREGFSVAGIDGSVSAIKAAQERFQLEGLKGELRVADFAGLPFSDSYFDLVVDRAALTCAARPVIAAGVAEILRVLKAGGRFLFNPYSDRHSSSSAGKPGPGDVRIDIDRGTLTGVGQICFFSKTDVERLLGNRWKILSMQHKERAQMAEPGHHSIHAEWVVIAEKEEE
jgi:ubiquinone/menaquinone biosynthesis C-methylase UbiE